MPLKTKGTTITNKKNNAKKIYTYYVVHILCVQHNTSHATLIHLKGHLTGMFEPNQQESYGNLHKIQNHSRTY